MSDTDIKLGVSLDGMDKVVSEFANLKRILNDIDTASPVGQLKTLAAEAKMSAATVLTEFTGTFAGLAKAAQESNAKVTSEIKKGVAEGLKQAQAEANKNPVTMRTRFAPVELAGGTSTSITSKGIDTAQGLAARAELLALPGAVDTALQALRAKSASAPDARTLLGLPSRDEAKSAGAQLAAQFRDGVNLENLRASSARAPDARTLLGLPSRDQAKTAGAQLAAQFREGVSLENLRAKSASAPDARTLLGLPSRDQAKAAGAQLAAQFRDGVNLENLRAKSATAPDARTILGLPSRDQAKTAGAQLAAQFREGVSLENLRAKSASAPDARTLLGIPRAGYSARASAEVFSEAGMMEKAAKAATDLTPAMARLAEEKLTASKNAAKLRDSYHTLTKSSQELHSATRGLASGFGAMWLTWGSIIPLMAGAAISSAVVQMVKLGLAVDDTMTRLRVLGGESAQTVEGLNKQMSELSKSGPFGPLEIAEAMKTLTLAGLSATEVASSIKDVLNFSLAGDVGIKVAADALTTISTAFGITATGFNYVSDTISKAAAESKSSVEDIAGAFKTAAVINQQYGVSLEETAVGLALLANAGIKNTAAGTSLRNMYADLSGRTKHVRDALNELGVKAFDPLTGKMRNTGVVFKEMLEGLNKNYSPDGARNILSRIFGERGEKEAFAIFAALREESAKTGVSVSTAYDNLTAKVRDAAGFSALAAAEIALTPMNQVKAVASNLQSVLNDTFTSIQPFLLQTATTLRNIINSEGFKETLQNLAAGVGSLTVMVTDHLGAIVKLAAAYFGMRAVIAVVSGIAGAMAAMAATTTTAAGAVVTLGLASRVAMAGNPLLMVLVGTLTLGAMAWTAFSGGADKAAESSKQLMALDKGPYLESLAKERDRLNEINKANREGITLETLRARNQVKKELEPADAAINAQRLVLRKLESFPASENPQIREQQLAYIGKQRTALLGLHDAKIKQLTAVRIGEKEVMDAAQEGADFQRAQITARANTGLPKGARTGLAPDTTDNTAKVLSIKHNNELEEVSKRYSSEMSLIKASESNKQRLLAAGRASTLVNNGTFYAEELRIAAEAESNQLRAIEDSRSEYQDAYSRRAADAMSQYQDQLKDNTGKKDPAKANADSLEALNLELTKNGNAMATFFGRLDDEKAKVEDGALTRMKLQAIALGGAYVKMQKSAADFWKAEADAKGKSDRATATEDKLRFASPEDAARISATAAEMERWNDILAAHDKAILEDQVSLDKFMAKVVQMGPLTEEQAGIEWDLAFALQAQRTEREKISGQVESKAKAKGESAALKQIKDERDGMVKSVADALETGMFEGGKSGGKKLRDILKAELRKPITVAITALVNTVTNSLFGGAGSGGGGGMFGGLLDKIFGGSAASPVAAAPIFDPLAGLAAYAGLPGFANGTNYVPHDMVAQIHRGERIVTASRNAAESNQSDQRPIVVNQNFTVGDVASVSMVRQAVAGSEKRIAGAMGRSMKYGGALS